MNNSEENIDITNIPVSNNLEKKNKNSFSLNESETETENSSEKSHNTTLNDVQDEFKFNNSTKRESPKKETNYSEDSNVGIEEQTKIIKESLLYLINLLNNCIERGGFQIGEVILINDSIQHLTNNRSTQEEQRKAIIEIIKYIYKAQSLGKLSLEEAYYCHLKVKIFLK